MPTQNHNNVKKYALISVDLSNDNLEHIAVDHSTLFRIKALIDIAAHGIKAGDLGGLIQTENSLSHEGNCWLLHNSFIDAESTVSGNALIKDDSTVYNGSNISGDAIVKEKSIICSSRIEDDAVISNSSIENNSIINYEAIIVNSEIDCSFISERSILVGCIAHGIRLYGNEAHIRLQLISKEIDKNDLF